jgi:hypothetical protein
MKRLRLSRGRFICIAEHFQNFEITAARLAPGGPEIEGNVLAHARFRIHRIHGIVPVTHRDLSWKVDRQPTKRKLFILGLTPVSDEVGVNHRAILRVDDDQARPGFLTLQAIERGAGNPG